MAKKAYVGVDNVARKIKRGYVGVRTAFPIYQTQTTTENVTINSDALLSKYFTVTNSGYGFAWNIGYSQFRSINSGSSNGTSQVTLTALQDCTVTYTYNYGTEQNFDKFTLTVKGSTIHSEVSGAGTARTRTDTLTKGQTIVFLYTKDGSVDNNGDYVAFYNMSAAVTTTKEVQVGTDYKNVARKIKKAYVGVGGVAKLCWGSRKLAYYDKLESLASLSYRGGCATAEDKLLVVYAGLNASSTQQSHFEFYDVSLTKGLHSAMLYKTDPASANVGKYAIFAGGVNNSSAASDEFVAMDSNAAIISTSGIYLTAGRTNVSGASLPNNAVFAGGSGNGAFYNTVEAIDADLTKTVLASTLPSSCNQMKSAVLDDCALFTYGYAINQPSGQIVKITDELTLSYLNTSECYTYRRYYHAAATAGNTVVIAAGYTSSNGLSLSNSSVSCNKDFTMSVLSSLTNPTCNLAGQSLGDYAMFACGYGTNQFEYYDASLTKNVKEDGLGSNRQHIMTSRIKDYALFLGGYTGSNNDAAKSVYAFTLQ